MMLFSGGLLWESFEPPTWSFWESSETPNITLPFPHRSSLYPPGLPVSTGPDRGGSGRRGDPESEGPQMLFSGFAIKTKPEEALCEDQKVFLRKETT